MPERQVKVATEVGLHARPAAVFVQTAATSAEEVTLQKGDQTVNAKSILAVLGVDVRNGDEITISSTDADVVEALAALVDGSSEDAS